jgi:hypothetical protein
MKSKVSDLVFALREKKLCAAKKGFAQRRKARKGSQRFVFHLNITCKAQPLMACAAPLPLTSACQIC